MTITKEQMDLSVRLSLEIQKERDKMSNFCVVYRTGGRENFVWHRSIAGNRQETIERLESVRRQGYKAFLEHYDRSLRIGLPETYGEEQ